MPLYPYEPQLIHPYHRGKNTGLPALKGLLSVEPETFRKSTEGSCLCYILNWHTLNPLCKSQGAGQFPSQASVENLFQDQLLTLSELKVSSSTLYFFPINYQQGRCLLPPSQDQDYTSQIHKPLPGAAWGFKQPFTSLPAKKTCKSVASTISKQMTLTEKILTQDFPPLVMFLCITSYLYLIMLE